MRPLRSRQLPERSKLVFEFPIPKTSGGKYRVTLPFFENIKITESKRAKYQKYDLISRSSQLYTYLGAESRKFNLEFTMNFPHILEEHGGNTSQFVDFVDSEDPMAVRSLFLSPDGKFIQSRYKRNISSKASLIRKKFVKLFEGPEPSTKGLDASLDFLDGLAESALNQTRNLFGLLDRGPASFSLPEAKKHDIIIDLVMYWTNIIRSSVLNYSENPIYGPPTIRLNHGILFQNIPCICTDYSLQPVEPGGYDVATLMPRVLKFNLTLEEIRTGDFGEFNPNEKIKEDNICGWEAVVSNPHQSVDPGNSL